MSHQRRDGLSYFKPNSINVSLRNSCGLSLFKSLPRIFNAPGPDGGYTRILVEEVRKGLVVDDKGGHTVLQDPPVEETLTKFRGQQQLTAVMNGAALLVDQLQNLVDHYEKHMESTRMSTVIITHVSGPRWIRELPVELRVTRGGDGFLIDRVIDFREESDK